MIVGYNHNILYQGVGFHVQTEDSGLKSPSLVTLLYHGGIIVTSQKTSYVDILEVDNLSQVVEDLAKEQHKGMLRRLTKGEFDQKICDLGIEIESCETASKAALPVTEVSAEHESVQPASVETVADSKTADELESFIVEEISISDLPAAIEPAYEPPSAEDRNPPLDISGALDDLIFSYLTGGNEKS